MHQSQAWVAVIARPRPGIQVMVINACRFRAGIFITTKGSLSSQYNTEVKNMQYLYLIVNSNNCTSRSVPIAVCSLTLPLRKVRK
jgi:hypothetical protein